MPRTLPVRPRRWAMWRPTSSVLRPTRSRRRGRQRPRTSARRPAAWSASGSAPNSPTRSESLCSTTSACATSCAGLRSTADTETAIEVLTPTHSAPYVSTPGRVTTRKELIDREQQAEERQHDEDHLVDMVPTRGQVAQRMRRPEDRVVPEREEGPALTLPERGHGDHDTE